MYIHKYNSSKLLFYSLVGESRGHFHEHKSISDVGQEEEQEEPAVYTVRLSFVRKCHYKVTQHIDMYRSFGVKKINV